MRYLSLFSGIEAASVAWGPLGWVPAAFAEIEPYCCALLEQHYPEVPNLGDVSKIDRVPPVDVLIGGSPCQSFSVAGKRLGMDDPRGNLALEYLRVVALARPRWVVFENVPGLLSSGGGRDFGAFLWTLGQLGYGWAYRTLDAQYFGVPQRRRRVFVVGYLGDWRPPLAVLFEPEGVRRDSAPGRQAGESTAASLTARFGNSGASGGDAYAGRIVPAITAKAASAPGGPAGDECQNLVAHTLTANYGKQVDSSDRNGGPPNLVTHALTSRHDSSEDGCGRGTPLVAFYPTGGSRSVEAGVVSPPLKVGSGLGIPSGPAIAFTCKDNGRDAAAIAPTLRAMPHDTSHANAGGQVAVASPLAVRRLTPVECERLQGFPDNWTAITYRGKPAADGPRYRALGNSMAVPVIRWLGERIALCQEVLDGGV